MGKDDLVILATLIRLMAEKLEEPISDIHGWINNWTAIALANLYSLMIHGYRPSSLLRDQDPDWDSVSGLGLAK